MITSPPMIRASSWVRSSSLSDSTLVKVLPVPHLLADEQMVVGIGCHLGQVSHTDHLPSGGYLMELPSDLLGSPSADTGVDLIKDHGVHIVPVGQHILHRQHDSGQLTAGSDLCQRLGLFAHIGADLQLKVVHSKGGQRLFRNTGRNRTADISRNCSSS